SDSAGRASVVRKSAERAAGGSAERGSVGDLYYSRSDTVFVCVRRVPRADLQTVARRKSARVFGRKREAGEAVRLDSRTGLPQRERSVRSGVVELAGAEIDPAPVNGQPYQSTLKPN